MKKFLDENFLLETRIAEELYHDYAAEMPIIDFHCHLSPMDIAEDRVFKNITEAWLEGDHYKWRAMRANGVDENYITGNATDEEKFRLWAETAPYILRNPLYHWTHLELQRYFGITDLLNSKSASKIYNRANELLATSGFSCRSLLEKMNVRVVCTTDNPVDDLRYHKQLREEDYSVRVLPTFRPDKAFAIEHMGYTTYIDQLGALCKIDISNVEKLIEALALRIDYFHEAGCRLSDHGLEQLYHVNSSESNLDAIFKKALGGGNLFLDELAVFKRHVLIELGKLYHSKGWVQQFHLGAIRNTNTRMQDKLGPDTGYDSIGDFSQANGLGNYLNSLDHSNQLSKTIVYNLNPADNEVIATMAGNFNDGSVPGKIQLGCAWWYLDQKDGMEKQLNVISNMGLLGRFVGMVTDSRSFMSFPRHEYFRRILCNLIGKDVNSGEIPEDMELLGGLVKNICHYNAIEFFQLDLNQS